VSEKIDPASLALLRALELPIAIVPAWLAPRPSAAEAVVLSAATAIAADLPDPAATKVFAAAVRLWRGLRWGGDRAYVCFRAPEARAKLARDEQRLQEERRRFDRLFFNQIAQYHIVVFVL
jgi:phage tail protein X